MFSVSKLIWLGVILIAVWNIFRAIEKRQARNDKNERSSGTAGKKADSESEPIATVYCSVCATFTAGAECSRTDCGMSG